MSVLDRDHYQGNVLDEVEVLRRKVESLERALPATVSGKVRLNSEGVQMAAQAGDPYRYVRWRRPEFDGETISSLLGYWDGGPTDDVYLRLLAYKPPGMTAGNAMAVLEAWDADAGTLNCLSVDSTGQVSISPVYGQQVNANMTVGLCINQYTNDDEVLAFKSLGDVAHGATGITETDVFGYMKKVEGDSGGLRVGGVKDSGGVAGGAAIVEGHLAENADTTKSTAGIGIVHLEGYETSGTGKTDTVANGNVLAVRTRRGGGVVTVAIVDEDGDLHLDGTTSAYDEEDDALAVRGLAQGLAGNWNEGLRYNFERLRELGVISGGTPERPFVSTKRIMALMMGAIGQLAERCEGYEKALGQREEAELALGDPG